MCVGVTGMWVMVNQVRQDIRDKRNMEMEVGEEILDLVEKDMSQWEGPIVLVKTDKF